MLQRLAQGMNYSQFSLKQNSDKLNVALQVRAIPVVMSLVQNLDSCLAEHGTYMYIFIYVFNKYLNTI